MPKELLEFIRKIEENEAQKTAVSYYDGCKWHYLTYAMLKQYAEDVVMFLQKKPIAGTKYILLRVDVTYTFPCLILGILKCGLGWCCLEANSCAEAEIFVRKLGIKYIMTNWHHDRFVESFPEFLPEDTLKLFGEKITILSTNNTTVEDELTSGSRRGFMYAMQTSGSTGVPKIVEVPFSCAQPNIADLSGMLGVSSEDVVLLWSPVTFDPSVVEMFLALSNGATLSILHSSARTDPQTLLDLLFPQGGAAGSVTLLQTTPSLFRRWSLAQIRNRIFNDRSSLRVLVLGGEVFPGAGELLSWSVPRRVRVFNVYGVTEVSCWSTAHQVWPPTAPPTPDPHIGQPLSETILQLSPHDGHLSIGSSTRVCRIDGQDSPQDGSIVFRPTGDIFKNVDNKLYFVGRRDSQIKRWGTRVSLTEIENMSLLFDNILSSVCISTGDKYIRIGLFIIEKNPTDLSDFRNFLWKKLPKNSWPDVIMNLESFPLSSHGKICRKSLAHLMTENESRREKVEDTFNRLWCHYTGGCGLPPETDFISAGGNSFTALQLVSELEHCSRLHESVLGMLLGRLPYLQILGHIIRAVDEDEKIMTLSATEGSYVKASGTEASQSEASGASSIDGRGGRVVRTLVKGLVTELGAGSGPTALAQEDGDRCRSSGGGCRLELSWKYNLGKCVDASPLAILFTSESGSHREVAIVGSHSGRVAVLSVPSGRLLSESVLPDRVEASAAISHCGHYFYIGCYDGCMYCIQVEDGSIVWKFQTGDIIKSTCTLYKEKIVFGSYDRHLYCLHQDGSLGWRVEVGWAMMGQVLVEDCPGRLYVPTLGGLSAWTTGEESATRVWRLDTGPIFSSPVLQADWIVVAEVRGSVFWVNKLTGNKDCVFKAEGLIYGSVARLRTAGEELLLLGCTEGWLYCLEMSAQLRWKTGLSAQLIATPLALPALTVAATSAGTLCLLSSTDGSLLSRYNLPGQVFSSPVILGNNVIVGCRDDHVYCLKIVFNSGEDG